jgi:hypothetical protein
VSSKIVCDYCGTASGLLHVDMRTAYGSEQHLDFCDKHGRQVADLLGFYIDTGVLLSRSRKETSTGESDIPKLTGDAAALAAAGAKISD